jgi:succinylglutamic semialdehyde dehydrogenase
MISSKTHFIDGKWCQGNGPLFDSHNPATGDLLWRGNEAAKEEIDSAVRAAKRAFEQWSLLPIERRIDYLQKFAHIINEHKVEFTAAISQEMGKPLWDARSEVETMVNKVSLSLKAYKERCASVTTKLTQPERNATVRFKPHGAVGVLGPFNFPGHLPNGHIIPALLAGNTIVFKPSEYVPKASILLMRYWEMAELPQGVLNMVQGGREVGQTLATHPQLDGLFFTGSARTGQWLSEYYGKQSGKILALELGGNNPLVISQIDNIDAAVQLTIMSGYITSGQRCTCARRLIVPTGQEGDRFIDTLCEKISEITVGAYTDSPEPFMGPVISEQAALKLLEAQKRLKESGGRSLIEMRHLKEKTGLVSPGLIDVTAIPNRDDEEHFGPLLQLTRVPDFQAAVAEANRTKYGLTAGLVGNSREEHDYFFNHVRAGVINWNTPLTGISGMMPFGGIGQSGNFRPSALYAADYCSYPVSSMESDVL